MEMSEKGSRGLSHVPGSRRPREPPGVKANVRLPFPAHTQGRLQRQAGSSSRTWKSISGLYFLP